MLGLKLATDPRWVNVAEKSIEERMKGLDATPTPLPFECYSAKQVPNAKFTESKMHEAFDASRIRSNREFFRMSPDQAKAALEIANGEDVTPKVLHLLH